MNPSLTSEHRHPAYQRGRIVRLAYLGEAPLQTKTPTPRFPRARANCCSRLSPRTCARRVRLYPFGQAIPGAGVVTHALGFLVGPA